MGLDRLGRKMHSYRQGELKAKDSFTTRASFLYGLQVLVSYFNTLSIVFNVKLFIYIFFSKAGETFHYLALSITTLANFT